MRRISLFLLLFALVLAGCGGSSGDVTVPEPPNTTAFEKSDSDQINKIIEGWQAQVPTTLTQNQIKQETIEQKVYDSTASLQEVVDFYTQQISSANGWTEVRNMPGLQNNLFLKAYDHGNISLVVGALDAKQFGGTGTVIYTAKGSK